MHTNLGQQPIEIQPAHHATGEVKPRATVPHNPVPARRFAFLPKIRDIGVAKVCNQKQPVGENRMPFDRPEGTRPPSPPRRRATRRPALDARPSDDHRKQPRLDITEIADSFIGFTSPKPFRDLSLYRPAVPDERSKNNGNHNERRSNKWRRMNDGSSIRIVKSGEKGCDSKDLVINIDVKCNCCK